MTEVSLRKHLAELKRQFKRSCRIQPFYIPKSSFSKPVTRNDHNESLGSATLESIEIQSNTQHTHFQTSSKIGNKSRIGVEPYTTLPLAFSQMLLRPEP